MRTILLFAIALPLAAQTVVTGSALVGPTGALASGTITITAVEPFTAAGGVRVTTVPVRVTVVNGAFSVALYPNDTGNPITSYRASWQLAGARPLLENWVVPTSSTPVTAAAVATAGGFAVQLGNIYPGAIADGNYCVVVVGGVITGLTPCSGSGGGALSWAALTDAQWTALTDAQWTALTN